MGIAFRLSTELVAGVFVGGAMGYFLDAWLGTKPVFILIFFVLGVAAGVLNVFRTAKQMTAEAERNASDGKPGS
jgi:ATP synthase protein I